MVLDFFWRISKRSRVRLNKSVLLDFSFSVDILTYDTDNDFRDGWKGWRGSLA